MSVEDSVVAIYQTHTDADRAVKELQRGGVDMHKLSIVGKVTSSFPQADKSRTLRRRRCRQRSGRDYRKRLRMREPSNSRALRARAWNWGREVRNGSVHRPESRTFGKEVVGRSHPA